MTFWQAVMAASALLGIVLVVLIVGLAAKISRLVAERDDAIAALYKAMDDAAFDQWEADRG